MRILVTGGNGQMATALKPLLPDATYLGRDKLDVTQWGQVGGEFWDIRPDVVLHTAAITNHQCPDIPKLIETNIIGTQLVSQYANAVGAKLVYLSTHYVYPGEKGSYSETEDCRPIGNYAWTKYAGEQAVKAKGKNHLIIRGSWYTREKLKLWRSGAPTDAYTNREYITDAAEKIAKLVMSDITGIVNIGGQRQSFYDLVEGEGHGPIAIYRNDLTARLPYEFPADSSVDTSKYESLVA